MSTVEMLCLMLRITLPLCTANIQTSLLWEEQLQYCYPDRSCRTLPIDPNATNCCGFCSCEEDCYMYGTCCLQLFRNFQHGEKTVKETRYECTNTEIYYHKNDGKIFSLEFNAVWMVARCSPFNGNYDAKILCENPGINNSLESVVPVTHYDVYYRNRFCAICNGINESTPLRSWMVSLDCPYEITYSIWNVLAKAKDSECKIALVQPDLDKPSKRCRLHSYKISNCNATGLWPAYNETIELACNAYVDPFNETYKNIFCYMCNIEEFHPPSMNDCHYYGDFGNVHVFPEFRAVIDINALKTTGVQNRPLDGTFCDSDQFRDEKNDICRELFCDASRKLVNQVCVLEEGWLCFTLFVKLTPENPGLLNKFFNVLKTEKFWDTLKSLLYTYWSYIEHVQQYDVYSGYSLLQIFVETDVDLVSYLFRKLHQTSNLNLENVKIFSEFIYAYYNVPETKDKLVVAITNENTNSTEILESDIDNTDRFYPSCKIRLFEFPVFDLLHVEPIIQLNLTELNIKIVDEAFLIIEESFMTKRFSRWEFRHRGGKIFISLSTYISIYNAMPTPTRIEDADVNSWSKPDINFGLKEYLAFVCVCLSMICLTVTVLTFVIHKDLQSQPGINTAILSISLFLAQAMYQFGAGQTTIPKWACALIGALCHFFWLAVMFSMNACSVGMFLVFRNLKKISSTYNKAQTAKTIIYIVVFSLAFVLVNIVYSVIESRGQSIGYGDDLCYFSSFWMQLITFIAPSLIIVLLNIALFVCVVLYISKTVPRGFNLNQERNYFAIYVRLSTLTGLTWLTGFLLLILRSEVLEYFFIILNGSQGMFIMIAFVLNKRVYNIWCRRTIETQTLTSMTAS